MEAPKTITIDGAEHAIDSLSPECQELVSELMTLRAEAVALEGTGRELLRSKAKIEALYGVVSTELVKRVSNATDAE